MRFKVLPFLTSSTAFVVVQLSKHDDTRSNTDTRHHEEAPSNQNNDFDEWAARKTFYSQTANDNENTDSKVKFKDLINAALKRFTKSGPVPVFRGNMRDYLFKPETVQLRSGNSKVYNVGPGSIVEAVNSMLSSNTLKKYLDNYTKEAALAYRAVEAQVTDFKNKLRF